MLSLPSYFFSPYAGHIPIRLYVERTTGFPHLHTTVDIPEPGSCETDAIAILYNKVSNLNALPVALSSPPERVSHLKFMFALCILLQLTEV